LLKSDKCCSWICSFFDNFESTLNLRFLQDIYLSLIKHIGFISTWLSWLWC
jgi:hypothetical protein